MTSFRDIAKGLGRRLFRTPNDGSSLDSLLARVRPQLPPIATVIDVGAAFGDWSVACARHFAGAMYLLIEPLEEYEEFLDQAMNRLPRARAIRAAASDSTGVITLHVHADLVGSSLLTEREGPALDGDERSVPAVTVDGLVEDLDAKAPFVLKVDVQGAERVVLAGATRTLAETELLVVEASLFEFFEGGVRAEDLIATVGDAGFALYDLLNPTYRPLDGALAQLDLVFARRDGALRGSHVYADATQRKRQDEAFKLDLARRYRDLGRKDAVHGDH